MIIFLPFITAFVTTTIITSFFIPLIKRLGIIDDPKLRKHPAIIHTKPVPRAGSIPFFLGIVIASFLFLPATKIVIALFSAASLSLIVGVLDDKFDISPYLRFSINILAGVIVVVGGLNITFITNPFGGILNLDKIHLLSFNLIGNNLTITLSTLITIVWVVWVMNMLNWSKGVDGQMPGIVAISAIVIGILSMRFPVFDATNLLGIKLSFIIAGAALGFLIFNFHKAKIFPGYGATSVYLLLSAVSILSSAKLATAILVMGVPMMDGIFTVLRRIFSGRSPFWHDKKHLHHLLLGVGVNQRQIALFYWAVSAILGTLSLILSSKGKLFAIFMVIVFVGGAIVFLRYAIKNTNEKKNN